MTEINRAVCVRILQQARRIIYNGGEVYVCHAVYQASPSSEETTFILRLIGKDLKHNGTLSNWLFECKGIEVESDRAPGMRETRLAWIDDMIRRFKL